MSGPLQHLVMQGATPTGMPDVLRRCVAAGIRPPSHFGPEQVAEYFPERAWRVLASGATVMYGVPLRRIVHLASGAMVGYEALVRGPEGSRFASANSLLEAAYAAHRVVEFDWVAHASACRTAMAQGLRSDQLLFMNIEPLALDSECPQDLRSDIDKAFGMFQVVLEVTERSLDRDPGSLLDGIERQRPLVAGLALDDVGADPVTVSMLPIVAPAVIKLDMEGPSPT